MLKEITRVQAIEAMTKEKPVFMLYELELGHTLEDILGAQGFMIEVEDEEPRKASSEPRNEAIDVSSEVKRQLSEVKRKLSEEKKAEKTGGRKSKYDRGKVAALTKAGWTVEQIADELGCADGTVKYIQKKNKEAEIKAESEGTEVNYDN